MEVPGSFVDKVAESDLHVVPGLEDQVWGLPGVVAGALGAAPQPRRKDREGRLDAESEVDGHL